MPTTGSSFKPKTMMPPKLVEANGTITKEWESIILKFCDTIEDMQERLARIENKPQDVWITDGQQQNTNRKLFGQ